MKWGMASSQWDVGKSMRLKPPIGYLLLATPQQIVHTSIPPYDPLPTPGLGFSPIVESGYPPFPTKKILPNLTVDRMGTGHHSRGP